MTHRDFMQVKEKFWWTNWSQTYTKKAKCYYQPITTEQILSIVKTAVTYNFTLKVVGGSHSPSDIALSEDLILNLDKYSKVLSIDREKAQIQVQAGIKLRDLNRHLSNAGLALSNLGSIDEQSIAGAISTGTHGTGGKYGVLGSSVIGLEIITSSGEIVKCSKTENPELFSAARCGLGALGIIITVTLQCEPAYNLHVVEYPSRYSHVVDNLATIRDSAEHVRIWWFPYTDWCWVWTANRTQQPVRKSSGQHLLAYYLDNIWIRFYLLQFLLLLSTFVSGLVPWIISLYRFLFFSRKIESVEVSHKAFTFDCLFAQHVSEWVVPTTKAKNALNEVKQIIETTKSYQFKFIPNPDKLESDKDLKGELETKIEAHFPIEIRFSQSDDDIALSPTRNLEDGGCWIGVIVYKPFFREPLFTKHFFEQFEKIMFKLNGRPHWAKPFFQDIVKGSESQQGESKKGALYDF